VTLSNIIIPTLGRVNNQKTYHNLPERYQAITKFVVQDHEYDEMSLIYGDKVLCLPKEIDRIAPTREWIFNEFKDTRHAVFDDDFQFVIKQPSYGKAETKFVTTVFTDQDFDDCFNLMESWMDEGIAVTSMLPTFVIPDEKQYPYRDNQRMMTNWFFDGPRIPRDLEWNRVSSAEDFDVNLQLLTRGFANRISSHYMARVSNTNAKGGCSVWRTLEEHNNAQLKLAELWPDYVEVKESEETHGPWKGQIKYRTVIQHKKAYASSKFQSLEDFFG
jgi:hypothetical protein